VQKDINLTEKREDCVKDRWGKSQGHVVEGTKFREIA